jgi:hypothetical protein
VWDSATGQPVSPPMQHDYPLHQLQFSNDGKRVMTIGFYQDRAAARVWDAVSGRPLTGPLKHSGGGLYSAFSRDGARLVTGGDDKTAQVWDVAAGKPIAPPMPHRDKVIHADFSPDGSQVVTAAGMDAQVWDAANGQPITSPMRHEGRVSFVAFSGDGKRVITISDDKAVRVWDAANGQAVCPPLRHEITPFTAAFSPDGTKVATSSGDAARIWTAAGGLPLAPPLRHADHMWVAVFSPDGGCLLTTSNDRTAGIWNVRAAAGSSADVMALAELTSVSRLDETESRVPLTGQERQTRWADLTARHPKWFLPPPSKEHFDAEMIRAPADAARLKLHGQWFGDRGQPALASQLLERARSAGAQVDPLTLARLSWGGGRYPQARREFTAAIAAESDPRKRAYLQQCLDAVGHDERGDWPRPATLPAPPFEPPAPSAP